MNTRYCKNQATFERQHCFETSDFTFLPLGRIWNIRTGNIYSDYGVNLTNILFLAMLKGMKHRNIFKPTRKKLIVAFILTALPYLAGVVFLFGATDASDIGLAKVMFWLWVLLPFFFVGDVLNKLGIDNQIFGYHSPLINNQFENFFTIFLYPLLCFLFWYLICSITVFLKSLLKQRKHA